MVEPIIKYIFPDYIYTNDTYVFSENEKVKIDKLIVEFISGKINFEKIIMEMSK